MDTGEEKVFHGQQQNRVDEQRVKALIEAIEAKVNQAKKEKFTFLLVGRTGVGKSSTVNSLMGKKVANTNAWVAETKNVTSYENEAFGIRFVVIDTPGLCDDLSEQGNDQRYLNLIKKNIADFDCLWFVTPLNANRVTQDEKLAMKLISKAFNKEAWNHAVIVFTFANEIRSSSAYDEAYNKRSELIRLEIARWTNPNVAIKVPSVAIDNTKKTLPNGKDWLGELYVTVFTRIDEHGLLPFLLATKERIQLPNQNPSLAPSVSAIQLNEEQAERMKEPIRRVFSLPLAATGAAVGAAVGSILGPTGSIIGGALGAILGGLFGRS